MIARETAIRLDGMLIASIASLDAIANYMKKNLSEEDFKKYVLLIGSGMGDLCDISADLHKAYPDIVPQELR